MVNSCYYFWLRVDTYGVNFPSIKPCGEQLTSTRQSGCVGNHQHRFQHQAPDAFAFVIIMQFIIASDTIVGRFGKHSNLHTNGEETPKRMISLCD